MMLKRQARSIEIQGVDHGLAPIPMGARVGNMVFSSGIAGKDPETNTLPPDAESQARFAFRNLLAFLDACGAGPENIARLTVYVKDDTVRDIINNEWVRLFPDPHDRPARHSLVYDLRGAMLLQLEVIAVIQ